jgi:transcriptional regulator with XRE-family HTH domain
VFLIPVPHPAKGILAARRLALTTTAEAVGCNAHTFGRVLNGYVTPWPALRRKLAEFLKLPEEELFRTEAR